MRKKVIASYWILIMAMIGGKLYAQNLAPNPSFETTIGTPTAAGQWNLAQPWLGLNGTPDLYVRNQSSGAILPCDVVNIPTNVAGYCDERKNGKNYMGLQFDLLNGYREYISVPLAIPMVAGGIYQLEFYVQLADSARFACNSLGMLLSNNIPTQPGTGTILFTPQLESSAQIVDTNNWTLVSGMYLAFGGENYVTLGLFRDDNDPLLQKTNYGTRASNCTSIDNSAYYFFDDIVVRKVDVTINILGDTIICPTETTTLIADCNVPFWWSDESAPNDTLSLDTTIQINPTTPTTYYLNTDFGTDSVTVLIVNPPSFDLGPNTPLCEGDTILLDATTIDGVRYTWSTGDTLPILGVTDTGMYYVTVENTGCARSDSISFPSFLLNPPIDIGEDSLYCFFYNDSLTLDAGDALSYLWTPTFETSREITILYPAVYSVEITRANGCKKSKSLEVLEICEPTVYIPNAFTPDGDGLNDIFRPYVNNSPLFNFKIINRRGQQIFYTEDPTEGWDGTYEGQDAPIGVYVYRINYQGLDSEGIKVKKKKLGTFTLLR
ncbi:MAG: gliding motility-associated C-terminal domain-containing protein [Bacteroidia bacterium]|jgi:gliding motility-associated-like protein|nr:gliding motility-associated C-terminal domain-containing protein [Bacteroidia bacterium]